MILCRIYTDIAAVRSKQRVLPRVLDRESSGQPTEEFWTGRVLRRVLDSQHVSIILQALSLISLSIVGL
jgi:hypothetical protein